jgi:hypothetical protein
MSASQRGVSTGMLKATSTPGDVDCRLATLTFDDGVACHRQGSEVRCVPDLGYSGLDRAPGSSHPLVRRGRRRSMPQGGFEQCADCAVPAGQRVLQ